MRVPPFIEAGEDSSDGLLFSGRTSLALRPHLATGAEQHREKQRWGEPNVSHRCEMLSLEDRLDQCQQHSGTSQNDLRKYEQRNTRRHKVCLGMFLHGID